MALYDRGKNIHMYTHHRVEYTVIHVCNCIDHLHVHLNQSGKMFNEEYMCL